MIENLRNSSSWKLALVVAIVGWVLWPSAESAPETDRELKPFSKSKQGAQSDVLELRPVPRAFAIRGFANANFIPDDPDEWDPKKVRLSRSGESTPVEAKDKTTPPEKHLKVEIR